MGVATRLALADSKQGASLAGSPIPSSDLSEAGQRKMYNYEERPRGIQWQRNEPSGCKGPTEPYGNSWVLDNRT